jgi:hypothetical protein
MKNKLLFIVSLVFLSFFSANARGKMKIVFRYDDYILVPSKFCDSLLYIFHKNNIPLCLGIIPFDSTNLIINKLNQEQINDLRSRIQKKEIEVALHGFNHINILRPYFLNKKTYSEFGSLSYFKQFDKLSKGKKALDSLFNIETNVFVPPFDTYDNNTLKALIDLNFKIISGDMYGGCTYEEIKYIPATFGDFFELADIIDKNIDDDATIVFLFHPYSFIENSFKYPNIIAPRISLNYLDSLLNSITKQEISFYTFSDLAKIENFNKVLYQANSFKYNLLKKVLNKLKIYRYGVYSSQELNDQNKEFLIFGNIFLHLLSFLFVYYFVFYAIKILHPSLKQVLILLAILSGPLFIYLYYIRNDFSFGIILLILIVNAFSIIFCLFRIFKPLTHCSDRKLMNNNL